MPSKKTPQQPRVVQLADEQFLVWADPLNGDPAAMLTLAQKYADDEDMVITTELDKVKIVWLRTVPCIEHNCWDGGGHKSHYLNAWPGSRGAFRAAFFQARMMDDTEMEARAKTYLWGVGSDGFPRQGISMYASEETAQQVLAYRVEHEPQGAPHRMYHRDHGDAPWREIEIVRSPLV